MPVVVVHQKPSKVHAPNSVCDETTFYVISWLWHQWRQFRSLWYSFLTLKGVSDDGTWSLIQLPRWDWQYLYPRTFQWCQISVMVSSHMQLDCLLSSLFCLTCYWPLWGECIGDRWIPCTKGRYTGESLSMGWHNHEASLRWCCTWRYIHQVSSLEYTC